MEAFIIKIAIVTSLLGLASSLASGKEELNVGRQKRIIGGHVVEDPERFPWLVSLQFKHNGTLHHQCGGTILNKRWVLTAAHCFVALSKQLDTLNPEKWIARIGHLNAKAAFMDKYIKHYIGKLFGYHNWIEKNIPVRKLILHKGYKHAKGSIDVNDIALVELKSDIPTKSKTIKLPVAGDMTFPEDGQDCVAPGWGCRGQEVGRHSYWLTANHLREVMLPKIPDNSCLLTNTESRLCAGFDKFSPGLRQGFGGVCKGDSGGPLVCKNKKDNWIQVGIVSFSANTGDWMGIYTRVSSYIDWIKKNIAENM